MSLQGLLWVKDSHAVSYMYSLLRNLQNILNVCRITALNGLKCLRAFMGMCVSKNNTDRQRVKAPLLCQINIDSTEGNGILLYTVKNTTWINFTISQFGVLIKKQQSPSKGLILTEEEKDSLASLQTPRSVNSKWRQGLSFCACTRHQKTDHRLSSHSVVLWMLFLCDMAVYCWVLSSGLNKLKQQWPKITDDISLS